MKHVVTNSEVYHLYANQREKDGSDWARNSSDSCSFQGRTAYSYRATIGYLYPYGTPDVTFDEKDVGIALLSSRTWTNTTSRHQSDLHTAFASHDRWTTYTVPYCDASDQWEHLANLAHLRRNAVDRLNARSWDLQDTLPNLQEWAAYARAFRLTNTFCKAEREAFRLLGEIAAEESQASSWETSTIDRETVVIRQAVKDTLSERAARIYVLMGIATEEERTDVQEHVRKDVAVYNRLRETLPETAIEELKNRISRNASELNRLNRDAAYRQWHGLSPAEKDDLWRDGDKDGLVGRFDGYHRSSAETSAIGVHRHFPDRMKGRRTNLLRVRTDGRIETSGGVRISATEARQLWSAAYRLWLVRTSPIAFHAERERLLRKYGNESTISRSYPLTSIDADGTFAVGCHRVHFDEMARLACRMGLIDHPLYWRMLALPAPMQGLPDADGIARTLADAANVADGRPLEWTSVETSHA